MKKWLLLIFIPILVVALVPALLPSEFVFERSIRINVSQEDAFDYLVNLQDYREWSPWLEKEPSAEFVSVGTPGVVGSYNEWKGQEIGSGRQTLTKVREPKYIETQLRFHSPQESEGIGYFKLVDLGDGVEVTWGMKSHLSYPIERVMGLFLPGMMEPDFKNGLENLKFQLEKSI